MHISINFEPSEKLSSTTLKEIAQAYMERIGFGQQPYLVYEHRDSGHPHLHVVTTNIQPNGKRIELHNLGKNQSEKARKAIEKEFGIRKAEDRKQDKTQELKSVAVKKVVYGQSETKRAITNVLDVVLKNYKYTSLEELNAVLRLANVLASRGSESSRTFQTGGLVYRVLDENGKPVGCRIKASSIYNKPTLTFLQDQFVQNQSAREGLEKRIKLAINWYFLKTKQPTREGLQAALTKEQISLVEYKGKNDRVFGLSYVDHKTGAVFKGSALGKDYAAKRIDARLRNEPMQDHMKPGEVQTPDQLPKKNRQETGDFASRLHERYPAQQEGSQQSEPTQRSAHEAQGGLPYELRGNQKKTRRRKRLKL